MATFVDGFGLTATYPTPAGASAGNQPAPYAVVAVVPAVPAVPGTPAVPANPGCPAYLTGDIVDAAYIAAHPGTTYILGATLLEGWPLVPVSAGSPAVPGTPEVPAHNPTKDGFGVALATVITYPAVDTTPADSFLDFAGGVANPKDGFGLPMTMVPAVSSTPQPTAVYQGYAKLA